MDTSKLSPFKFQETADPKTLTLLERINTSLISVINSIKGIRIEFPRLMRVEGTVSVDSVPQITVENLRELKPYFAALDRGLVELQNASVKAISELKQETKTGPEEVIITESLDIKKFDDLLDGIEELKKGFNLLLKKDFSSTTAKVDFSGFKQFVPTPVTNFNVNPLRGDVVTTAITVTNAATALPTTALPMRRAVMVFNNSGSTTLYIGGDDVTSANGTPVLAQTYSPVMDLGPNMPLYGITASSTVDARVLELSNDVGGTH